jgi:hypothetical protein
MSAVPAELRRLVIESAKSRCEYGGLSQARQEATFHIDHIVPRAAGGETVAENFALACVSCSLRKAARQTAMDPHRGHQVALYHSRRDTWAERFRWQGIYLVGLTSTGRATAEALRMNRPLILAI